MYTLQLYKSADRTPIYICRYIYTPCSECNSSPLLCCPAIYSLGAYSVCLAIHVKVAITMAVRHRSHRSFLSHLKALETAITDPGGLATSLYQEGLIDRLAWQRADNTPSLAVLERSRELLQKVEVKIEQEDATFDTFLSILSRDPSMEDICRQLKATRGS